MITKEEYLKLIYEAYSREDDELSKEEMDALIPAEPEIKKKIQKLIEPNGDINATKLKKYELTHIINKYNRINIGNFLIYIKSITNPIGNSNIFEEATEINENTKYNVIIYEQKKTTPSGIPCNLQIKINIAKDNRFQNKKITEGFSQRGGSLSSEFLIDLMRLMQIITKLPSFI